MRLREHTSRRALFSQIHKNLEALDSHQSQLRAVCMQLHPQWRFMFWSDDDLDAFVARQYSWYYLTWQSLEPRIKQIDTARYMLMHHFGGCVTVWGFRVLRTQ